MNYFWRLPRLSLCLIESHDLVHVEVAHECRQFCVVPNLPIGRLAPVIRIGVLRILRRRRKQIAAVVGVQVHICCTTVCRGSECFRCSVDRSPPFAISVGLAESHSCHGVDIEDVEEFPSFFICVALDKFVNIVKIVFCGTTAGPENTDSIIGAGMFSNVRVDCIFDVPDTITIFSGICSISTCPLSPFYRVT